MIGDHPNYNIIKIGQNTEKSPENLRRLAVTQTPVRSQSANAGVKKLSKEKKKKKKKKNYRILWQFTKKDNLLNSGLCHPGQLQSENKRKYKKWQILRSCQRIKKLCDMKVMVRPTVIGELETIPKGLVRELEELKIRGWVETIQTKALLRSDRILRRVLDTWEDLLSLRLQWKTIR